MPRNDATIAASRSSPTVSPCTHVAGLNGRTGAGRGVSGLLGPSRGIATTTYGVDGVSGSLPVPNAPLSAVVPRSVLRCSKAPVPLATRVWLGTCFGWPSSADMADGMSPTGGCATRGWTPTWLLSRGVRPASTLPGFRGATSGTYARL